MTSGYEPTSYQAYNSWVRSNDWIRDLLRKPLVAKPGAAYHYSTGNTHLLSAILVERSGLSTREFAERYLFGPMGIEVQGWTTDPQGIHMGGNNLSLLPLDVAKFGQLYLDGGRWANRQLVSQEWVDRSLRPAAQTVHPTYGRYGRLWWLPSQGVYSAVGYGGQYILISPRHDAVVVLLSTHESKGDAWEQRAFALLRDDVLATLLPTPTRAGQGRCDAGAPADWLPCARPGESNYARRLVFMVFDSGSSRHGPTSRSSSARAHGCSRRSVTNSAGCTVTSPASWTAASRALPRHSRRGR